MHRALLLLAIITMATTSLPAIAQQAPAPPTPSRTYTLMVADGQILSRDIVVRISPDLPKDAEPVLYLDNSWADENPLTPTRGGVAHNQTWMETGPQGVAIARSGTIAWYRVPESIRPALWMAQGYAVPRLQWTEGNATQMVMLEGRKAVGFGNLPGGWLWTAILTLGTATALAGLVVKSGRSPTGFLVDSVGYWSLSGFQILLWTLATGAVVTLLALMRLQLPNIPDSLVVLMGLSLVTAGGAAALSNSAPPMPPQTGTAPPAGTPPPATPTARPTNGWDAIAGMVYDGPGQLSLARGQMLFWTIIMVAVFLVKSITDGIVWEVPWQMVALMGLSQAGYLASKKTNG